MCESARYRAALGLSGSCPHLPYRRLLGKGYILTCGKVKQNSCVFYSFGAEGHQARAFADNELGGKGITFKNALDDKYMSTVIHHPRFGDIAQNEYFALRLVNSENLNRREIFIRKLA